MVENNSQTSSGKNIRVVTNILTKALKLWLKSQVSEISQLDIHIQTSDRQLLTGNVPLVSIGANYAVYQGLHLTKVQLVAENIRINIGSILKGKAIKLLEIVPVVGELSMEEVDLNTSISSDLLSTALNDVLDKLLPEDSLKSKPTKCQKIVLDNSQLILFCVSGTEGQESTFSEIRLNVEMISGQELHISQIEVQYNNGQMFKNEQGMTFYLGTDVDIQELKLIPGKLVCRGRINVNP
ncbi:LmeA family phospholipid-binding protein [Calothrix sp. 336/3]|uniref:LmeA family phospholipid-binding protein n=1 Tax=Calothrix sp. 336/3 TaxID=1337936 RepID=UPI0004E3A880|nr:DUF2993 domain-containing protein [Calothrix sp. 336/3]AKG24597.1 hypothetical protein IJ00_12135 [Calothrix sp. 336/3]